MTARENELTAADLIVALEARAFGCEYRMSAEGNADPTSGDAIDARIMSLAASTLRANAARIKALEEALDAHGAEIVSLYDRLAGINDEIEVGDDGYARFASLNDRDLFREIVRELEPRGLFQRGDK